MGAKGVARSEQARLVKTVNVHSAHSRSGVWIRPSAPPMGNCGRPCTLGRGGGINSTHMPKLMPGSLSTGSPAGHLNTRQRGVPVHGGSMYSQAHVNPRPHTPEADHRLEHNGEPKRVSMAPGGRRLLKRGKPRALGVAGLEVEDPIPKRGSRSNRPPVTERSLAQGCALRGSPKGDKRMFTPEGILPF